MLLTAALWHSQNGNDAAGEPGRTALSLVYVLAADPMNEQRPAVALRYDDEPERPRLLQPEEAHQGERSEKHTTP